MIIRKFFKKREDGVNLYRIYSNTTSALLQQPTGLVYVCWDYNKDGSPNFETSGVIDIESAPYTYEEFEHISQEQLELPEDEEHLIDN